MVDINSHLTEDQVRHLARLARIELTDEQVQTFQRQLAEVIDYNVTLLAEVEVEGVKPTAQTTGLINVWRDDEVAPSLTQDQAMSNAPQSRDGQFEVPKVLGEV